MNGDDYICSANALIIQVIMEILHLDVFIEYKKMWEYGSQYYADLEIGIIPVNYLKEQFLNLRCVNLKCCKRLFLLCG